MSDREASITLPLGIWARLYPSRLWAGYASIGTSDRPMQWLHAEQNEILDEAKKLFDASCARRHKTMQSTWNLIDELQRHNGGGGVIIAWMRWYGGTLQRIAEDAMEQLAFGCKAAERCTAVMAGGFKSCAAGAVRSDKDGRDEQEKLVREHGA